MAQCPNKSIPEWKNMVNHVGEFEAYRAYIAHNEAIPNAVSMKELKSNIGLIGGRYSESKRESIRMRLDKFNKDNLTSHVVNFKKQGESLTATGALQFSYMPTFEQVQDRIENENRPRRRLESGLAAAQQERLGPKYQPYIEAKQAELTGLFAELALLTTERTNLPKRRGKDGKLLSQDEVANHKARIAKARKIAGKKLKDTKKSIEELVTLDRLDQIELYAEDDMKTLAAIFAKENQSGREMAIAKRLIKVWQQGGDFSGENPHIFFDPEELKLQNTGYSAQKAQFLKWMDQANGFNVQWIKAQEKYVKRKIRETIGYGGVTEDEMDFDKPLPDIGFLVKNMLDMSEIDHIVFQAMSRWVKDANNGARLASDRRFKELDEKIKATGLSDYDMFRQTFGNNDKRFTGQMVNRFTYDYVNWLNKVNFKRDKSLDIARNQSSITKSLSLQETATRAYVEEMQESTSVFDARILFWDERYAMREKPTETEIQAHKDELIALLGQATYDKYYEFAKDKNERFFEDLQAMENDSVNDRNAFIVNNSPYLYARLMQEGYDNVASLAQSSGEKPSAGQYYAQVIPKKANSKGEDTGFYDQKFDQIAASPKNMDLYNHITDLLEEMKLFLPGEKINFMEMNSIPVIEKKFLETVGEDGMSAGFGKVFADLRRAVRTDDLSTTGKTVDEDALQLQMIQSNKKEINDYVDLQDTNWRSDNPGEKPTEDQRTAWEKEKIALLAEEKSFDLGRVMKAFTAMALTYHHKSMIEDQMKMANDIVKRSLEEKQNAAKQGKKDVEGNPLSTKGLENLNSMLDSFMKTVYLGYPSNKAEGVGKKDILTKEEKRIKVLLEESQKELDDIMERDDKTLTEVEYKARKEVIQEQLDNLGGRHAASKYGDLLLKYIQIKGMGWNVYAGFANMGFGLISNFIEGADGRNYTHGQIAAATRMTLNSVVKNLSFHVIETGTATKIATLMHDLDVLKQSADEIYETTGDRLFKKVGKKMQWLDPYNPQARSEYFNQAPVMIAMLMATKVTNKNGEETTLWKSYNNDGTLKEGTVLMHEGETEEEQVQFLNKIKSNVDQVVKMNHGNYDPDKKIKAKETFIGRAATQFRGWALQGFAERWYHREGFKDNNLTNNITGEEYIIRKGRYWSYGAFAGTKKGLHKLEVPFIVMFEAIRSAVGKSNFSRFESGSETFNEVDAANMRKNAMEIMIIMTLIAITLLLKGMDMDDDDPAAKRKRASYNLFINMVGRLNTDMQFYVNPMEFERLSRNMLPLFTIVTDGHKVLRSGIMLLDDNEENDFLQSGPDKDKSRFGRDITKMLPLATQIKRLGSAAHQEYKKNTNLIPTKTDDD